MTKELIAYKQVVSELQQREIIRIFLLDQGTPRPIGQIRFQFGYCTGLDFFQITTSDMHNYSECGQVSFNEIGIYQLMSLEEFKFIDQNTTIIDRRYLDTVVNAAGSSLPSIIRSILKTFNSNEDTLQYWLNENELAGDSQNIYSTLMQVSDNYVDPIPNLDGVRIDNFQHKQIFQHYVDLDQHKAIRVDRTDPRVQLLIDFVQHQIDLRQLTIKNG